MYGCEYLSIVDHSTFVQGALGQSPGLEAQPNTQINLLATAALAASEPNGTQKLCPTLSPDRFKADARPTTGNAGLSFADQSMNQTGPGDGGNHQQQVGIDLIDTHI